MQVSARKIAILPDFSHAAVLNIAILEKSWYTNAMTGYMENEAAGTDRIIKRVTT